METLDIILEIAKILLFLALIALSVYLIFAIKKIIASLNDIQRNVTDLKIKAEPVIQNANVAISNVNEITASVKAQMVKVDSIVTDVQNRTQSILDMERRAQEKIEAPLMESLNVVSATLKGVKAFFQKITDSHGRRPLVKDSFKYNDYDETPDEL